MLRLPELEIGLAHRDQDSYQVELRFTDPQAQGLRAPQRGVYHLPVEQLPQLARTLSCIGTRWKILIFAEIEFFGVGAR